MISLHQGERRALCQLQREFSSPDL